MCKLFGLTAYCGEYINFDVWQKSDIIGLGRKAEFRGVRIQKTRTDNPPDWPSTSPPSPPPSPSGSLPPSPPPLLPPTPPDERGFFS